MNPSARSVLVTTLILGLPLQAVAGKAVNTNPEYIQKTGSECTKMVLNEAKKRPGRTK